MRNHGLAAAMAAACILSVACGSDEAEPNEVSSSAPSARTTPTPTSYAGDTAPSEEELPLYGTYLRDVTGFEQDPPARRGAEDEWALHFRDDVEQRDGVLEVYYFGKKTSWGRAYEYSSDDKTLRLGAATRPKDVPLRLEGFECRPEGPATYAWIRSEDNRRLRLEAVAEPCAARRTILAGKWFFLD